MGRKLEREQGYLRNDFSSKTSSELKAEEAGGPRSKEWAKSHQQSSWSFSTTPAVTTYRNSPGSMDLILSP